MEETSDRGVLGRHQSSSEEDWSSIRRDRMQSFFNKDFKLIVFQKLLDWRLEKSEMKKHTCHLDLHQRSYYATNGQRNWVQNMLNDQKDKLSNNPEISNRTNQFQTQIMMIERSNPLSELTREPWKMEESPVVKRLKIFSWRNCQTW